jgi:hypothetical protein
VTAREAKAILLLYRPGTADAEEPEIGAALELARRDAELARWLEQHCAFQAALRARFRELPVPERLRNARPAGRKIIRPQPWWNHPVSLAAAAAVVLFLGLAPLFFKPDRPGSFTNFQSRMIGSALREYRMDVVTNDMRQVRAFIAAHGAPADYQVAPGLGRLQLTGGGLLRWRSNPVAMVCFDRGDNQMLFLFVLNRAAVKDPPPEQTPRVAKVRQLLTASWSQGDNTYLLAGPDEPDFVRKYLGTQ